MLPRRSAASHHCITLPHHIVVSLAIVNCSATVARRMDRELYNDLSIQLVENNLKVWTPESILITFDDVQYNLMDSVGKQCLKENELLYLPEKFSMDMSKDDKFNSEKCAELTRALRIAASEAGFTLVIKGWLMRDSERIEYKCHRNHQYKDNRKRIRANPACAEGSFMPFWIPSHLG
jgi:hypothetical protein